MIEGTIQPRLIWYQLVDSADGKAFRGADAAKVSVPLNAEVDDFRKAVKSDNPNNLSTVDAANLVVYKNKDAFDKRNNAKDKEEPLKSSAPLHALGPTEEKALIVLVPTPVMSTNGHKAIDISESLYQALTQPFDREPTLTELAAFLSSEPLLQIPLLPPRHDSVTRYFFEPGMGRFTGRFRLTQTEDFSMAHSLESLPTMQFQIGNGESTLHYFVDLFMRQFFEVIIASTTLKVRMDRNTTDSSRTTEEKKKTRFLMLYQQFSTPSGRREERLQRLCGCSP
jgi:hypothetical protein